MDDLELDCLDVSLDPEAQRRRIEQMRRTWRARLQRLYWRLIALLRR